MFQFHERACRTPRCSIFPFLSLLLATGASWAVDPGRHISQYGHAAWRVQDGVFTGAPSAITQTADGYMWIGTENGVVRFDGVRFTPWKPDGNELPSSDIFDLLGARDGSLWVATAAGLTRWHDGVVANFIHDSSNFEPLVESRDGTIWVVREERLGSGIASICQVTSSALQCHRDSSDAIPPTTYMAITEDTSGNLWIGSQTALVRWKPGSSTVYTPPALASHAGIGISAIAANPDGSLWVGMALRGRGLGLQHFEHGVWKSFVVPGFDSSTLEVLTLALDRNNTLWIGTSDQGIYRISGERVDHFGSADGLSGDSVRRFFEDREGNVWVTTSRGIDCFHDVRIASFAKREGITVTELDAVLAARDGTVWIGGANALNALHNNKLTSIHAPKGVPGNQYTSLFEDHAHQIWIGIDDTLWIYANGAFHRVTRRDGRDTGVITDITEDVDNNIWAESIGPPRALLRIRGLTVEEEFPAAVIPAAHTIGADRESGIWLGLLNGDLARYRHGNFETFHFEHALPSHVLQISVDPDGSVLGATPVGLIGWRNGTQRTLTVKNGLPCDAVFAFVRDGHGALWLYTQCGLVQIADAALQDWWEHSDAKIPLRIFDSSDGVQPEGAPFRSAAMSPDGRLWFVNLSLLQMIDPAHLDGNLMPPPVHIEQIVADRRNYSPKDGLRLPALTRDLEIDYTALSFVAPQKMRFRYRLDGRDTAWQDSGSRRQAFYTDLRPGHYRFRAVASNNDGIWNETGAAVDLEIPPAFFQTKWFLAICIAAGAMVLSISLWCLYKIRIRSIEQRYRERKLAAEKLERSEGYLSEAQRLSSTGSIGWNVSSGEIYCSEETYKIFEFDRAVKPTLELILQRIHPDDRAFSQEAIARASREKTDFDFEHRLLVPGGAVKRLHVKAHALQDASGNLEYVGAVMDVTTIRLAEMELHKTRTELAHAARVTSLGELTASIAHEVNQPLGAVVTNAEAGMNWLDCHPPDMKEAHAAFERIAREGNRAGEIIRRVRTLARKTDIQMAQLELNETVSEALALVQHELLGYRVSMRMDLATALPRVLADRVQLQQVILNLVLNGIEAMQSITDRARELIIRSEQCDAQHVRVTVTDCGVGFSAENAERLFTSFFTTKSSGMGMGLSICRSIIDAHGGRIWATPNLPHGATIQFTLPSHPEVAP
jgi:C4-dicarboxylate-specific signal transduction histidine kinase/ligand-binding sensor domain-containing protein